MTELKYKGDEAAKVYSENLKIHKEKLEKDREDRLTELMKDNSFKNKLDKCNGVVNTCIEDGIPFTLFGIAIPMGEDESKDVIKALSTYFNKNGYNSGWNDQNEVLVRLPYLPIN